MYEGYKEWIATYDKKALKILADIKLTQEEKNELKMCMNEIGSYLKDVFEDIYKLYISGMSARQISEYYNKGYGRINLLLRTLGIQRSRKDALIISASQRDYSKIRKKFKKTIKERYIKTQLFGSEIENLIRVEINEYLNNLLNDEYEIIVGINTVLSAGELDIPIIVIKSKNIYKLGIEVDNDYIHKNRKQRNKLKISNLKKMGYYVYKLNTNATLCKDGHIEHYNQLQDDIKIICNEIVADIKKINNL
ncbi:hypothetical protein [Clostridium sp. BL-8]|uniref:hypothetical protein n=1 Tax=Clostridium sp. BL-8 TaxID=349938 RepID=UPI00098C318A|nr:hypothetical protein [Clostridium sp. BL-8]OOM76592.1 hypothetical protein CLOBL_34770 [Clostridium sp. BL-8]